MLKRRQKIKTKNPLLWIFETLEDDPHFFLRKLFSFDAAHLGTRVYLAVSGGDEPWNGLLVCTAREHHASLLRQFPQLVSHAVLASGSTSRKLTPSSNPSPSTLPPSPAGAILASALNPRQEFRANP